MQADPRLWRVDVTQERDVTIYAVAESAGEAAAAVESAFCDDWFPPDFDNGKHFTAWPEPTVAVPESFAADLIVHPDGGDITVSEWLRADAERRAEAAATPGTPEYRAAVEAAGQAPLFPEEVGHG